MNIFNYASMRLLLQRGTFEVRIKCVNVITDSQAAMAAIKKAGCTRRARTSDLAKVINEWKLREGRGSTKIGWVKA